jgi:hypothetical protein
VQRLLTSGPKGWPTSQTPWLTGPNLQPLMGLLHRHALKEAVTKNPKLEVGGSLTWWPIGHVARPAGQYLACYRLNQVGTLDPYKCPLADGIQDTTLYL